MSTTLEQKFDDATVQFVSRDLIGKRARTYKKRYPQYKLAAGRIVPIEIDTTVEWEDEVEVEEYDSVGMNALIADYTKGGPRVGTVYRRARYPIHTHGNHAAWNWEEINKARAHNRPLQGQRMEATRDSYDKFVNKIGFDGDPTVGLPGLFTVPMQRAIASVPINSSQSLDNILASFGAYVSQMVDSTGELAAPAKIILPVAQHHYLFNTYRAGTDKSIGQAFLESQKELGYIREVIADNNLKGKGTNGQDVMLILPDDVDVISMFIPMPYRILPEQQQNLEFVVHTVGRISGIHCKRPMECMMIEGI